MPILITDPHLEKSIREQPDRVSEVWDGVEVMSPVARFSHLRFVGWLIRVYGTMIRDESGEVVMPGTNLTDQPAESWEENYRVPDVIVLLEGNPTKIRDTHICGGPDVVVEVLSPSEDPTQKFAFYANVAVRELMVVDLAQQTVELFQPQNGVMTLISKTDATGGVVQSTVLPVEFSYAGGTLVATHTGTGQTWTF
ncbi:MAG: Uma2 family endonuclease [Gemmataceae bacterium]